MKASVCMHGLEIQTTWAGTHTQVHLHTCKQQQQKLQKSLCFKVSRKMEANVPQELGCLSPITPPPKNPFLSIWREKVCSISSNSRSSSVVVFHLAGEEKVFQSQHPDKNFERSLLMEVGCFLRLGYAG